MVVCFVGFTETHQSSCDYLEILQSCFLCGKFLLMFRNIICPILTVAEARMLNLVNS
jgi:hypothetical protein